jgi:hypothetical protein
LSIATEKHVEEGYSLDMPRHKIFAIPLNKSKYKTKK